MSYTKLISTLILGIPTWIFSLFVSNKIVTSDITQFQTTTMKTSFYDLEARTIDGKTIKMSDYKGKKLIIINAASKCGYTSQYEDWQTYYEANRGKIEIIAFPCNQFMGQEPGTSEEIAAFCKTNYDITFQLYDKVDVKGGQQSPIYKWLTDPTQNGWNKEVPSWNFCKYVINEKGELTHFFASKIKPTSEEFIKAMQ